MKHAIYHSAIMGKNKPFSPGKGFADRKSYILFLLI